MHTHSTGELSEFLEEAIELINGNGRATIAMETPTCTSVELATILFSKLYPDEVRYDLGIFPTGGGDCKDFGIETPAELVVTLKEHAQPCDSISIVVTNYEFDEIGEWRGWYQKDGVYLIQDEVYGAGIGLDKVLTEIANPPTAQTEVA